jgi:recombinational DNA repair protein (RecF pathway)
MDSGRLDDYLTTDPRDAEYRDDLEECACCGESLDPQEDEHENADSNLAKHANVDEGSILCLKCCEEATEKAECAVNDLEDDLYDAQEDGNEEEVTRLKAAIKAAQAEAGPLTAAYGGRYGI